MVPKKEVPQGILKNEKGELVILLPAGPIRISVEGMSGEIYQSTLHDNPELGRPVAKLSVRVSGKQS